ncbi:MAG: hypothetical protein KAI74_02815 [Kiritimatiellae bacterium]|nr:hypothetical protein [Kiritimatiellia bacterium]
MKNLNSRYPLSHVVIYTTRILEAFSIVVGVIMGIAGVNYIVKGILRFEMSVAVLSRLTFGFLLLVGFVVMVRGLSLSLFYLFADTIGIRGRQIISERKGKELHCYGLREGDLFHLQKNQIIIRLTKGSLSIPRSLFQDKGEAILSHLDMLE